uniref:Uncharacterized protein n=1 Tax=Anguilla anguilla TaxID=7936 RepID=A0A0E9RAE4_ANGAN
MKTSIQPCKLHRLTLAVEWVILKSSVNTFNVALSLDATFQTSQCV